MSTTPLLSQQGQLLGIGCPVPQEFRPFRLRPLSIFYYIYNLPHHLTFQHNVQVRSLEILSAFVLELGTTLPCDEYRLRALLLRFVHPGYKF